MTMQVAEAYEVARNIARKQARNFYYAFVALPEARRNAICAVYAFMRHADDLSDDETRTREDRRMMLAAWLAAWHRAAAGEPTDDPVFIALADARHRFQISLGLLDQLVHGTSMDLIAPPAQELEPGGIAGEPIRYDTYATFKDLYQYCYYVASVVGLVCIRIFGYSDPRAEKLAEETGIAFQLTNILRDVREDADRGRIYLPLEDLERFEVELNEITSIRDGRFLTPNQRELLAFEAKRADEYYASGVALLPLISPDARPALRVLISIYRRLLIRIRQENYDVFSAKIKVPTLTKLWILLRGLLEVAGYRIFRRA